MNNMNRILCTLTLTVLASGSALAQDTVTVPAMDPFCAEHFANTHTHGRRCAVCEEEFLARCDKVDGTIDACPCGHFLAPDHAIDPTTLSENGRVLFEECVKHGYLALPPETPDVDRNPIDRAAVLAALDAAISTREGLIKAEKRLGRDVTRLEADLAELRATRVAAAKDLTRIDVAALLRKIPAIPPPPPRRSVRGPNLVEGIGTVAGGVVIGAGAGAGVGFGFDNVSVLSGSAAGGLIGLGVGVAAVIIWEIVAD